MAANARDPKGFPQTVARLLSAAANVNATLVSASPSRVFGITGYNARGSAVYLKIYNKATAPAETDTPFMTLYLPATAYFNIPFPANGVYLGTGLGYRM